MRALAFLLLLVQAPAPASVDLGRLLAEKHDPASRARLPDPPYRLREISGSHVPGEASSETLLAEIEGPGALVRIETRAERMSIQVRIDGHETPVHVAGPVLDLPIPFATRCRVSAEGTEPASCRIEYRAYPTGTKVESATKASIEAARTYVGAAAPGADTFTLSVSEELPEGGLTCVDPSAASGPRAVTRIHLRAEATDLALALRRATLRLTFDGETTVECPLGEFFGCSSGPDPREDADFSVAPGIDEAVGRPGTQVELVCRLVMPYRERFDLSIDARRAGDLHVAGVVRTMPWTWDERTMRFRVSRSEATRLEGEGVLVGESVPASAEGACRRRARLLDALPFGSGMDLGSISRAFYYARPGP